MQGLRGWAVARPRVLVVDAPGTASLRWIVEAELDRRGWPLALSPADTDILLVLGTPGPQLAEAADVVWGQIPEPRHRHAVASAAHAPHELDAAARALVVAAEHPEHAVRGLGPSAWNMDTSKSAVPQGMGSSGHEGMDHSGMAGDEGMDHSGMAGDEGMDHSGMAGDEGMDHSGMAGDEGMDHSGMAGDEGMDHSGMAGHGDHMHHGGGEVAGLPMAETAPDRDGLALDVLRVSLGPVMHGWPTGLVLRADLQGDVLTGTQLSWLDPDASRPADPEPDPQRRALDRLATLLSVAGWPTAARDARLARDGLASEDLRERAAAEQRARRLARRVRRARALAWSVRGVGRLQPSPESAMDGDILDRVRQWCDVATGDRALWESSTTSLDALAGVLDGTELATTRLIVASLELERSTAGTKPQVARA